MTSKDKKTDDGTEKIEATTPVAAPITPVSALARVVSVQPASDRIRAEPKRLSKGQRKHLRRLKQAGEVKTIRPR